MSDESPPGFKYAIASIEFSDGSVVELPRKGIAIIVGPNNAGKSRCLREVHQRIHAEPGTDFRVTHAIKELRIGGSDGLYAWLCSRYRVEERRVSGVEFDVHYPDGVQRACVARWNRTEGLQEFGATVSSYLDTARRLTDSLPHAGYDAIDGRPEIALHELYLNDGAEDRVSSSFRQAFSTDLVLDRAGGTRLALRCGGRPIQSSNGRLSLEYGRLVRQLPRLDEQGDGMRSYASCLLHTDVLRRPVVLIDEPEAFLHPPQARMLALHLGRTAREEDRQVIVATHSGDVLRGALDSAGEEVAVIRLTRSGDVNRAHHLDSAKIGDLWRDPLFRASNLLDGLFHSRVVLCEADGDCRFYRAVLEETCRHRKAILPDVMFAHVGGKQRLAKAARALVAVAVPVTVVADLDVLREESVLQELWEALGQTWDDVASLHKQIAAAIASDGSTQLVRAAVRRELDDVLARSSDRHLADAEIKMLRESLKAESSWDRVKRSGLSAIPQGQPRRNADDLIAKLRQGGLFVAPVGELEGFMPDLGGHGPDWVARALERDLAIGVEAAAARDFIDALGLVPA